MNFHFLKKASALCLGATMAFGSVFLPQTNSNLTVSAADSDNYAKLLQYSLYFYDANMCGKDVESVGAMSWRGNCHTDDEVPGGYHDAGDHAMFGLPQGYSAATLGWTYYEYKNSFDSLGLTAHFKKISKHFTDFFKASTKMNGGTVSSLLYQKGDGNADHAYWGPPESQGSGRKMFWSNNGASDIAAEYAAALALDYLNFGDTESLDYAKALYKFSTTYNQVATEGCSEFYKSSGCQDEQAFAAGWLYIATKDQQYLNDCKGKQTQYQGWVHGWDNTYLGAACVLAEITGDWSAPCGWMSQKANGSNYLFLDKWGSARLNCAFQTTAMIATKHKGADYSGYCKGQMNYILGSNPANTCFVVGFAGNSANKPHHRACSGVSTAEDNSPSKYTLVGALVGGPTDQGGSYQDSRSDYVCNEVACDYNAALVGAAAGLYDFYKSGSVEKSIEGVKNVELGGSSDPQTTQATQQTQNTQQTQSTQQTTAKTTSGGSSSSDGCYTMKVNQKVVYSEMPKDDKMIGFKYEDFGIPASSNEKITKIEVDLSTTKDKVGKWQGAFGSSTKVEADKYWTQTDDMESTINGQKGTITWKMDSATADIIQYGYDGELKFGIWWIDCDTFSIDEIRIYTDGNGSSATTAKTTEKTTATTKTTTSTTKTTTTTTTTTTKTTTTEKPLEVTVLGDINCDNVVNISDAILGARYVNEDSGVKNLVSELGKLNGDANKDGSFNMNDITQILRIIARF